MKVRKHGRRSCQITCYLRGLVAAAMPLLLSFAVCNVRAAFAFGFHRAGQRSFVHPLFSGAGQIFSQPDVYDIADDDDRPLILDEEDSEAECETILNGTAAGLIVNRTCSVPLGGFTEANGNGEGSLLLLSKLFSPDDMARLRLEPQNVTLPAALMLLDPEKFPTQSRARKAIRQRSICISRRDRSSSSSSSSTAADLEFDELGKVISRIYPGDVIGFQRRAGSDYYAVQGTPYRPPAIDVPVVYEDDHMAIVDKPAGAAMYRGEGGRGGHGRVTLISALPFVLKPSNFNTGGGDDDGDDDSGNIPLKRPQAVHRLDRPTSGLVVVAKTKAASVHLSQQFEFRKAKKTYTAIVNGSPPDGGEESNLEWNSIDHDLDGKSARTEWRVIRKVKSLYGKDGQLTLVELKPKTGRYHQLRRHMAWVCDTPIAGDTTYDGGEDSARRLRGRGLFLCSNGIELEHPYYNSESGRKEWIGMVSAGLADGSLVYEDEDTGTVMVKARIAVPQKFESFLYHENARATKFTT